jgi:murein DD-endopeptidase MepM/ murein hydrolase activator NlpD
MPSIRSLRLSRGMTLVELALAAGIPARTLGAIEHGLLDLDADCAARLASVFGLAPDQLYTTERRPIATRSRLAVLRRAGPSVVVALISSLLLIRSPLANRRPASVAARVALPTATAPTPSPRLMRADAPPAHRTVALPLRPHESGALASPAPTPTPPLPTPTPAFRIEADGPHGCPLVVQAGRIVVTQGYGEGTHAPATIWGALDLAIDGDDDGYADPATTDGATIVATHDGVARVYFDSWPGGNFVLLEDTQTGWSTGYAHMSSIAVADGQAVAAGTPLGTVGSTGLATGPHLHYEVRRGGVNLDPSGLIECEAR